MGDEGRPSDDRSRGADPSDRLDSWKELSAYLGRGVRTIQRWEKYEGLPVHRHVHAAKGSVYAFRSEVDAWRVARSDAVSEPIGTGEAAGPRPDLPRVAGLRRPVFFALGTLLMVGGLTMLALKAGQGAAPATRREAPVARPLAVEDEGEFHQSLSPDGREVVYNCWSSEHALMIRPTAGGPARALTAPRPEQFDGSPTWSPRGDAIAFLRQHGWDAPRRDVLVVSPAGGAERRLTTAAGIGLAWAPDGRSLAFVDSDSAGEPHAIFLLSLETGERRRLTSPPLGTFGDLYCAFSPDGRTLAFSRWPTTATGDVWVMPAGGGDARPLTRGAMAQEGLDWTPDGTSIVFASRRGGQLGLWSVRVTPDGSDPPAPVPGPGPGAQYPSFSRPRDGGSAKLAFEQEVRDVNIWRWRASDSGAGTFDPVVTSTWYDDHPSFSRDGTRLLFTSNRTGHNEVWSADADGSHARRLTQRGGPLVLAPRYSPDGLSIAFVSTVGENRDVFVASADGSGSRRLTFEPSEEGSPSWSRDGRWIYFRSNRGGLSQIWKAPAAGGPAVRVTRGEGWQAFESPDGLRVYFVRSRELPGVWSIPSGGGPETLVVPDAREGRWAVADSGIYFLVDRAAWNIARFDFRTRATSDLATLPGNKEVVGGFDVSPDGRSVLWTQIDTKSNDIMLLEPWVD